MTKLELTSSWPTVVRMAGEGASLREIAEEVNATPGAINVALKRMGIEKAPAPPGPRARRGAAPPPPKEPKAPKVKGEKQPRQKASTVGEKRKPGRPRSKTFPEVLAGVFEEFGYPNHDMTTPEKAGDAIRSMFVSLGLTRLDNLSDDNTDDCDENTESDFTPSVPVDADSSGEDDNGNCDGEANTDEVVPSVLADFDGLNVVGLPVVTFDTDSQPSVVGEVIAQTINEDGGLTVQIAVDPNEVTLRGEVIESPDDWGTPPGFTIPDDETLSTMNRDDLRKLAANPACRDAFVLKGYSKMNPENLRKALAQVRNNS